VTARRGLVAILGLSALAAGASADPAAWRVADEHGAEIWLLGSMHYLREQDYPLPPSIDRLYDRADSIVMELDLDDLDSLAQQSGLLTAAVLPQGTTLRDVLDRRVYELAETYARAGGIELELLASFEPWLVAITLLDHGMSRLGFESERGIEQYLLAKARRTGKEIRGLESLETQIRIFDELSARDQEALLEQTLAEIGSAEAAMRKLAEAWRDGRLEALREELLADFDDFPDLYTALVTDRNERWIAPLEALLAERRRCLVVVGALHLVGPDSVLALLEARGYRVARL
jgi:uncharacterized protein YbaP (TraB family)